MYFWQLLIVLDLYLLAQATALFIDPGKFANQGGVNQYMLRINFPRHRSLACRFLGRMQRLIEEVGMHLAWAHLEGISWLYKSTPNPTFLTLRFQENKLGHRFDSIFNFILTFTLRFLLNHSTGYYAGVLNLNNWAIKGALIDPN